MARGRSSSRGGRTRSGRIPVPRPQPSTDDHADEVSSGRNQNAQQTVSESGGSGGPPSHIDPAVIFEILSTIQNRMDGVEAKLDKQAANADQEQALSEDDQEEVQLTPPHGRNEKKKEITAAEFIAMKPPVFSGEHPNEDPQRFLDDCEKICDVLECPDPRRVTLVSYQLRGQADKWWRLLKQSRGDNAPPMLWKEFRKEFRDQFIPRSVRDARMREFETLRQGSRTVDEYHSLFLKLSEYAPHMVQNEEERVWRFVEGLRDSLYSELGPNLINYKTYATAVDVARRMERRSKNREEFNNKRKRGQDKKPFFQGGSQAPTVSFGRSPFQAGSSQAQAGGQGGGYKPLCNRCGRHHNGECFARTCYSCGQAGHFKRECPQLPTQSGHGSFRPAPTQSEASRAAPPAGRGGRGAGRGQRGGGQPASGRGTARVYAMNRQDAQASNAVVAGIFCYSNSP